MNESTNEAPTVVTQFDLFVMAEMARTLLIMRSRVLAHAVQFGVEPGALTLRAAGISEAELEEAKRNLDGVAQLVASAEGAV